MTLKRLFALITLLASLSALAIPPVPPQSGGPIKKPLETESKDK